MATVMYLATLETRHFSFTALGRTEEDARRIMREAWGFHAAQTGAAGFEEFENGVAVLPIRMGGAYRDGEEINVEEK